MPKLSPAVLKQVPIDKIDPNPFRNIDDFPPDEEKIEELMRSIEDSDFWEGLQGREVNGRIQLAFGIHRFLAAKRLGLTHLPILVREISDEMMLKLLANENLEALNHDFLHSLEAWQAVVGWFRSTKRVPNQAIDIATFLGWTRLQRQGSAVVQLNNSAAACHAAHQLIAGGHLALDDLADMTTSAARSIVERAQSRIEMLQKLGEKARRPVQEIERDKKRLANAARSVARDVRDGNLSQKDIRGEIDFRAVKDATAKEKVSPLFALWAKGLADSIHKIAVEDTLADKLEEIERALPMVTLEADKLALGRIDYALGSLEETTGKWRKRLKEPRGEKVVPFRMLSKSSDREESA